MNRNYFSGLKRFMQRWENGETLPEKDAIVLHESVLGNMNVEASPECFESSSFARPDSRFVDCIESGVRELVLFLTDEFGCITYSSCQGHPSYEIIPMRERHVGIVPRNEIEYSLLLETFRAATNETNKAQNEGRVRVIVQEEMLESEDMILPCLDLFFVSIDANKQDYFEDLESVYQQFLNCLRTVN